MTAHYVSMERGRCSAVPVYYYNYNIILELQQNSCTIVYYYSKYNIKIQKGVTIIIIIKKEGGRQEGRLKRQEN